MTINLAKVAATSEIIGLQNLGAVQTTGTMSGTIPALGFLKSSFTIPLPSPDVLTIQRVQLSGDVLGSGITNYWFPLVGSLSLLNTVASHGYYISIYSGSDVAGRKISVNLINNENNSAIPVSNLSVTVYVHYYTYPF